MSNHTALGSPIAPLGTPERGSWDPRMKKSALDVILMYPIVEISLAEGEKKYAPIP
jgi:hypothetical protein